MISFAVSNFTFGLTQLHEHQLELETSLERLATGKRINRAKDDPSGVQAVTNLKVEEYAIRSKLESFEQERAFLGTQEGALSVISELVIELESLSVQAANADVLSEQEQNALVDTAASLIQGIDHIVATTEIKNQNVLSGFTTLDLARQKSPYTDPETGETTQKSFSLKDLPRILLEDPELAQSLATSARESVSSRRAVIGTRLNNIDSESRALITELENTSEARSMIEDTDFAEETAKLVRAQILQDATIKAIQLQRESLETMLGLLEPAKAVAPNPS